MIRHSDELQEWPTEAFAASVEQRFWQAVKPRGPDQCWLWTGAQPRRKVGHGMLSIKGAAMGAHRVSFMLHNPGKLRVGGIVCHICNNPPCVNPAHLYQGTMRENTLDAVAAGKWYETGRKKRQHPLPLYYSSPVRDELISYWRETTDYDQA